VDGAAPQGRSEIVPPRKRRKPAAFGCRLLTAYLNYCDLRKSEYGRRQGVTAATVGNAWRRPHCVPDLELGGRYFQEISRRIATIGARAAGHVVKRKDAQRSAEELLGPAGELAADFMTKTN
jgi:hypothetical protein